MRLRTVTGTAAALLAGAAALLFAGEGTASAPAAPAAPAEAGKAAAVERHSPPTGAPSLGPEKASNTLVFFTDYQCPVCPRAAREMERLVADFKGDLRVEVRHNPLAMHKDAFDAAAAAKAAQRQGKFWEYHAALVAATAWDRPALARLAQGIGLDMTAFTRDLDDPKLRDEIGADIKAAADAKAVGTPGFLINGHVEVGWGSLPGLEQMVRTHWK
jgi:protein-disulfide isomerase